ncbi:MAG: hypothetical protein GC168_21015 [Candidatus Hydrogenedens sp.]|nr:hypothetical protein [Candidatus Hydrogenedens sp.]
MSAAPQVVCMGELLVDMMAHPGGVKLPQAEHFVPKPGGAPANVAVGLRRLGVPSAFVGMVGQDAFGTLLRDTLEAEQVDIRSLATTTEQPTTLAFVAIDAKGVPDFSFYRHPGADLSIKESDVDASVFESSRVFHFGSLSLTAPPARDTTLALLTQEHGRGRFITYDPNYRPALWPARDAALTLMRQPLSQVHLLKVSEEELAMLSGIEDDILASAAALVELGPRYVIVTRGEEGLTGWCDGEMVSVPGRKVEVVETTGCGDASMAGVIAALLEAYPDLSASTRIEPEVFERALRFANAGAAIAATRLGAIPSLPTRAEVEAAL